MRVSILISRTAFAVLIAIVGSVEVQGQSREVTTLETPMPVNMIDHPVSEKKYDQTETQNLKLVRTGLENWKNGTGSPYALLATDAQWTIVGDSLASRTYKGRQDFIDNVITPFNQRMSKPLVPTIRRLYADGDTVVAFFDAEGTATDGKRYANTYAWFLRLREGQIVEATAFFDSVRFNDLWTRVTPAKQAAK